MPGHKWKFEAPRHHTDDHIRLAVQKDLASQDCAVTMEPALPRRVADHRNLLVLVIFLLREHPSLERRDAQRWKHASGHPGCIYHSWLAHAGKLIPRALVASQAGKAVRFARVVLDIGRRNAGLAVSGDLRTLNDVRQDHELVGVRER